ncbi:MAG: GyrI-like domain-containing protein [Pirellulaceae bacterium]|nr:GyrI-like domain-containing protein [Pirellulaceae bacterium]
MEVKIEKFPPLRVAFVRHVGPYDQCEAAWHKLCSHSEIFGCCSCGDPEQLMIGVCHDDPDVVPPEKIRYDAGVTVSDDFQPPEGVEVQELQGGDYGVIVHYGSYDGLLADYKWFYNEWLPGSGRKARSGPTLEIYRNSPSDTPPEKLETEIRIPLRDA